MQVRSIQGDTLDAIAWRIYGKTVGCVEALMHANHRIAELGPVLPIGTLVEIPVIDSPANNKKILNLWD